MSRRLVVVESPAKCKKIEEYLGPGYTCIATYGHLRELRGLDDIVLSTDSSGVRRVDVRYADAPSKSRAIATLRAAIPRHESVLLATDSDREGEAIAWHVCDMFGLPVATTPRMIFTEITKGALQAAVQCTGVLNMALVNAQKARQVLDMWIGFKVSPLLWRYIRMPRDNATGLSSGRCQTPALRLVYDNDALVNKSWEESHFEYETRGYFGRANIRFSLAATLCESDVAEFMERSRMHRHLYGMERRAPTRHSAPTPFTTSSLQQTASNRLRMSPKETMRAAQTLYEEGLITYMRTDCAVYSEAFRSDAAAYIVVRWSAEYCACGEQGGKNEEKQEKGEKAGEKEGKRAGKKAGKKAGTSVLMAQEAHEAIRPTKLSVMAADLAKGETDAASTASSPTVTARERRLYELIWTNTLESCMAAAHGESIRATLTAPEVTAILGRAEPFYRTTVEQITFHGWMAVRGVFAAGCDDDDGDDDGGDGGGGGRTDMGDGRGTPSAYAYVDSLVEGQEVPFNSILSQVRLCGVAARYTESRLVKLLEQNGIGRPSTYASLVDKLTERKYVKVAAVEGVKRTVTEYRLERGTLAVQKDVRERVYGGERSKMRLESLGAAVSEYLASEFGELFSYEFTSYMEERLDGVAKSLLDWHGVCADYWDRIEELIAGACARGEAKKTSAAPTGNWRLLGEYEGIPLHLHIGRYGYYARWGETAEGERRMSLPGISSHTPMDRVGFEEVVAMLRQASEGRRPAQSEEEGPGIRQLTASLSVRRSKYGSYVFYKKPNMRKPTFLNLKKFRADPWLCEPGVLLRWLSDEYRVSEP